jgi:flagellum-specific peptidoglycan hydrolase FlgJ
MAPFRAYRALSDSLFDHADLFNRVSLNRPAMQVTADANEFARRVAAAGTSTDPGYAQKLIGLMQRYDLYLFDRASG